MHLFSGQVRPSRWHLKAFLYKEAVKLSCRVEKPLYALFHTCTNGNDNKNKNSNRKKTVTIIITIIHSKSMFVVLSSSKSHRDCSPCSFYEYIQCEPKNCHFGFALRHFLSEFLTIFVLSENRNEYSTAYLPNSLMTSRCTSLNCNCSNVICRLKLFHYCFHWYKNCEQSPIPVLTGPGVG